MTIATTANKSDSSTYDDSCTSTPRLGESTCHILPCNVDFEGMANTHVFFKPVQVENGILAGSFRGRGLLAMQDEDKCDESKTDYPVLLSLEENRIQAKVAISNFVEWHHEHSIKSLKYMDKESIRVQSAKEWIEVSKSVRFAI